MSLKTIIAAIALGTASLVAVAAPASASPLGQEQRTEQRIQRDRTEARVDQRIEHNDRARLQRDRGEHQRLERERTLARSGAEGRRGSIEQRRLERVRLEQARFWRC